MKACNCVLNAEWAGIWGEESQVPQMSRTPAPWQKLLDEHCSPPVSYTGGHCLLPGCEGETPHPLAPSGVSCLRLGLAENEQGSI